MALEVILSILAYSVCSGSLLLVNKLTLQHLPYPSLVITAQLLAAIFFIYTAKLFGLLDVDPIKWKFILPYLVYNAAFSLGVYCNMMSLSTSNVETVIIFRALAPLVVSVFDAMFLGREWPSVRSWGALTIIAVGSYGYACADEKYQSQGLTAYAWPFLYLLVTSFVMAYGKKIISSVNLKTKSGPVVYTNLFGWPPVLLFAAIDGEYGRLWDDISKRDAFEAMFPPAGLVLLFVSCVFGTLIGYAGWWCRDKVSATSYTLIGVMNKCITVLANLMIWDQHANLAGISSLMLCLVGGALYRQAPMRISCANEESKEHRRPGLLRDLEIGLKNKLIDEKLLLNSSDADLDEVKKLVTWTQAELTSRAC